MERQWEVRAYEVALEYEPESEWNRRHGRIQESEKKALKKRERSEQSRRSSFFVNKFISRRFFPQIQSQLECTMVRTHME